MQAYLLVFLDFLNDPLRKRVCANGKVSRKGNRDIASKEFRNGVIIFREQVPGDNSK
jgi:hypothetical protein